MRKSRLNQDVLIVAALLVAAAVFKGPDLVRAAGLEGVATNILARFNSAQSVPAPTAVPADSRSRGEVEDNLGSTRNPTFVTAVNDLPDATNGDPPAAVRNVEFSASDARPHSQGPVDCQPAPHFYGSVRKNR